MEPSALGQPELACHNLNGQIGNSFNHEMIDASPHARSRCSLDVTVRAATARDMHCIHMQAQTADAGSIPAPRPA
ncbi:hypothetical protein C7G42_16590 [Bradyrhizobium sp. MOS003]|nr:hypothetical protein C7G42_16590 [Bradyrhizobium sp. MOS003]